jgi:hypothetical protein
LIDFKKELAKFKPAKTMDDFHASNNSGEFFDVIDCLKYVLNASEKTAKEKATGKEGYYDTYK